MTSLIENTIELFKRHRKLGWFCLLAVTAAIGITLWSCEDGEPPPPYIPKPIAFSVSFQGYSNSPSGQRWAILIVTNRDFGNLSFPGPSGLEFAAHPKDGQETHLNRPDFLPPGSCGRIVVEIPPAPGAWRASCKIMRWTWRDTVRDILSSRGVPDSLLPRPTEAMEDLVTEWVTNQ